MKKVLLLALVATVLFSACSNQEEAPTEKKLVVWSFTDELQGLAEKYYQPAHSDVALEFSMTPTDQFTNKLDPVLASGQGTPDVFALEDAFVRKYIESGLLLDLTDVYEEVKDKVVPYMVDVATYDDKVYGLAWQVTPGAMFYRRSLAKEYLGTDDPEVVQEYFANFDKTLETAELLKTESDGACVLAASVGDILYPFKGARQDPWVVDGKLVIDTAMEEFMDMAKVLRDEGYEARHNSWSEGWFAGMKGDLKDEQGNPVEVFSYFLPTWGLHYVLKTNAPDTSGDWAMIPGPAPYRWGGTWIAAWKDTKQANVAKEFIKYLATDDTYLESYALESGDVVSNINVTSKIKDDFSEPFLGGQNHYAAFVEMANDVDGKLTQGTDQAIEMIFNEAVTAYQNGEKSKEEALEDFKSQVTSTLGIES